MDDEDDDPQPVFAFATIEEALAIMRAEEDAEISHTLQWNRRERRQRLN